MALGSNTFTALGGAASDLFSIGAYKTRAAGNRLQAEQYDVAKAMSLQNKQFTETSTAIKEYQIQREVYSKLGEQQAEVASSGFAAGGTAADLLRDSAAQGALHKAVAGQQGLIEEASYEAQAKSYDIMARSARMAADEADRAGSFAGISAAIKGVAAVASVFTGGADFLSPIADAVIGNKGGDDAIGIGGGTGW